jgi:hypothetical protein
VEEVKISQGGHDSYGNDWRETAHDDLVLSLAMAVWYAEKYRRSGEWWGAFLKKEYSGADAVFHLLTPQRPLGEPYCSPQAYRNALDAFNP